MSTKYMKPRGTTTKSTSSVFYNKGSEGRYLANYSIANITPEFVTDNKPMDWDINAPHMKISNAEYQVVPFAISDLESKINDGYINVGLAADAPPSEFNHMKLYDNNGNGLDDSYYELTPTNTVWKKSTNVEFNLSKDAVNGLQDPMDTKDDDGINMYKGLYNAKDADECSNKTQGKLHICDAETGHISRPSTSIPLASDKVFALLTMYCEKYTKPFIETNGENSVFVLLQSIQDAYDLLANTSSIDMSNVYDEYRDRVNNYMNAIDGTDGAVGKINKYIDDYNGHLTEIWDFFNTTDEMTLTIDDDNYLTAMSNARSSYSGQYNGNEFNTDYSADVSLTFSDNKEAFLEEYGITRLDFSNELAILTEWTKTQEAQNSYETNNIKYIAGLIWQMYVKRRAIKSAEPATRTMYIDSNIALTSGDACINSKTSPPRIIPNLFNAIETLQEKTNQISKWAESHKHEQISTSGTGELSTADKMLYVENHIEQQKTRTTIVPQKTASSSGVTTGGSMSDALRLRAGNIEFEIESANIRSSGYVVKYEKVTNPGLSGFVDGMNYMFVPVEDNAMKLAEYENYLADGIHGRIMYEDGEIYRVLKSHIVTDSSKYLFKPQKEVIVGVYDDMAITSQAITNINSDSKVPVIFSMPYKCLFADWSGDSEASFPYKFATYVDAEGANAIVEIHETTGGELYVDWKHNMADSIVITNEVPLYLVKTVEGDTQVILDNEEDLASFIGEQEGDDKTSLESLFGIYSSPVNPSAITGYKINTFIPDGESYDYELCPDLYIGSGGTIPWTSSDSKYSFELVECRNVYENISTISPIEFQTKGTTVYNLQAIVEAIQELNRRTMFMDTDISFGAAMSFNDVAETDIPCVSQEMTEDGLPAAGLSPIH